MPQIEVTFDIDANGIVNVSAKDLGTGKEQHITITSSTNMSKEDVEKAVKEAEQYAAEDKKKREEVDIRNGADQMVFQTEKAMGEFGDKVSESEKTEVNAKLEALKEALKGSDIEAIKAKQEDLQKAFYAISEKVYKDAAAAGQAAGPAGARKRDSRAKRLSQTAFAGARLYNAPRLCYNMGAEREAPRSAAHGGPRRTAACPLLKKSR